MKGNGFLSSMFLRRFLHMNDDAVKKMVNRAVVAAITHDETRLWLLNDESQHPFFQISRSEPDHAHVRQAQTHHGHASEIGEVGYFNEIANVLSHASRIVLMGHGTGKANAATRFEQHVSPHWTPLLAKIVATGIINIPALSDSGIIQEARRRWKATVEMS